MLFPRGLASQKISPPDAHCLCVLCALCGEKNRPSAKRYAEDRTRGLPSAARLLHPEHRTYAFPFAASHEKKSHTSPALTLRPPCPLWFKKHPSASPPPPKFAILTADISFRSWYLPGTSAGLAHSCTYASLSHGCVSFSLSVALPSGSAMCLSGNAPGWLTAVRRLISNGYRPIAAQQGRAGHD